MNFAHFLQIVATISAVVAVTLGIRTFSSSDYTTVHIVFGSLVTLALLIVSIMTVATRGLRRLRVIGIVYALMLLIFGSTQQMIWVGNQHWLIQALTWCWASGRSHSQVTCEHATRSVASQSLRN